MKLLIWVIGILLGFLVKTLIVQVKTIGTLNVVKTDDDHSDSLYLNLDVHPSAFKDGDIVSMRIKKIDHLAEKTISLTRPRKGGEANVRNRGNAE